LLVYFGKYLNPKRSFCIFVLKILMLLTKKKIINSIESLPDQFSIDELVDRIVLLQKIEIGLEQSENGETYSHTDARKKLEKWLK
jgi:hypothetical protein